MSDVRVKIAPSEIKVGDFIEVETRYGDNGAVEIARDKVIGLSRVTIRFGYVGSYSTGGQGRAFYLLPKPAPDEPTGLGAVVEDGAGDLWVRLGNLWGTRGSEQMVTWSYLLSHESPLTVKSHGYTP